jgi:hypothetical protein
MSKFFKRTFIFLVPFLFIILTNYIVDPYSIRNKELLKIEKRLVTEPLDYRLSKLAAFLKDPKQFILLGDSRIAAIKTDAIYNLTKKEYANLAYGAGTLEEAIITIDYIKNKVDLKEISIGIPFNLFNASNSKERVTAAINILKNKLNYYFSYSTSKASLYVIIFNFFNVNLASEIPDIDFELFWQKQLSLADYTYQNFKYPKKYIDELNSLSVYCKENKIELKIIIPPTHIDLQNKIVKNNLISEYNKYKAYLNSIGNVYDFDIENNITKDLKNFKDPYHFNDSIMLVLVDSIWKVK